MRKLLVFCLLVATALPLSTLALPPYPPPIIAAQVLSVDDGDTIFIKITSITGAVPDPRLAVGSTVNVRYIGIDTQETHHPTVPLECFGPEATQFNISLVEGKTVYLELDQELWDRYNRLLAYVYLDPNGFEMVNAILVALGYADVMRIEPDTRYADVFEALEDTAISLGLGLWSQCVVSWEKVWESKEQYLNQEIVVSGEVKSVGFSGGGAVFLNIGNPYPQTPRFTVVIWRECRRAFEERFGDLKVYFEGKTIHAYGTIELYQDIPEIELCDPDYIWLPKK